MSSDLINALLICGAILFLKACIDSVWHQNRALSKRVDALEKQLSRMAQDREDARQAHLR